MIKLNLPFWLDGPQLAKLKAAAQAWWDKVEGWLQWPLLQMDADTCHITILDLLAWQRISAVSKTSRKTFTDCG